MGKVTYLIDHYMYIPKTVKAQLSPYLPFKEGWRLEGWLEVGGGGGGWQLGGQRNDIF